MGPRRTAAAAALAMVLMVPGAPAHAATPGRGTGTSSVSVASVTVGSLVDVDLVTLDSTATLDRERQKLARNAARGTLTAASVDLGGKRTSVPAQPVEVVRDEVDTGTRRQSPLETQFSVPGDLPADQIGANSADVARLVTGAQGAVSTAVGSGMVAQGKVRPVDLLAVFEATGARASGGSTIDSAEALGGLVTLTNLGVAEQAAWAEPEIAGATSRELKVDAVRVLDTGAVLRLLGVDPGAIPLATLAAMADRLGVPLSGALGSTPLSNYDSWADARQTLSDTKVQLEQSLGLPCGALPGAVTGLLGQVGVSCSGTTQAVLDTVNGLLSDLLGLLTPAVEGAALLSIEDVAATVQAVTSVSEDGVALTSAQAGGSAGKVKVGGVNVGAISADLTTGSLKTLAGEWNALQSKVHAALDGVLGTLGVDYTGLVSVQVVPTLVQNTGVEGEYATAEARMALLRAQVTLPATLPDPQDLATGAAGSTPVTTPTTLPATLPTPTTTVTLPVTTSTVTLPTLPIAHVRDAGTAHGAASLTAGSLTVDVGVLSATAEFTRPGVAITGGGENRTWDPARATFGPPGSLPRTGAASGGWPVLIFAVLWATALTLRASLQKSS